MTGGMGHKLKPYTASLETRAKEKEEETRFLVSWEVFAKQSETFLLLSMVMVKLALILFPYLATCIFHY